MSKETEPLEPAEKIRRLGGEFETCCHFVEWWYDVDGRLSREAKRQLRREAYSRARSSIVKGFWSGDLCATVMNGDEIREFWGWWQLKKDRG